MATWDRADPAIAKVIGERPLEYDTAILDSLAFLLDAIREDGRPPPEISAGYWPTFRLTWEVGEGRILEVEVFADHYEIYPPTDGEFLVRHEDANTALSAAFWEDLPRAGRA